MDATVKKDIISVLEQAIPLLEKEDFDSLKELSNHTIHDASIMQDKYSIQISVIIYSMSKILEKAMEKDHEIHTKVKELVKNVLDGFEKEDDKKIDNEIKKIFNEISKIETSLYLYIQEVIDKAGIVKGSNIYRHGISLARVSEILGVSQWELMSYVGKTRIADEDQKITDVKKRIGFARELFNL